MIQDYYSSRAAELAHSLPVPSESIPQLTYSSLFLQEFTTYALGRSLYDLREFRRAADMLKDCQSDEGVFLKLYSLFMVS